MKFVLKNKICLSISALLLLFTPIWIFVITPELIEIPNDFSVSYTVDSYDNFYDTENEEYSGEQRSITSFVYKASSELDRDILEVENSFEVKSISGDLIFSVDRTYGVNTHTTKHVPGYGDRDRNGYLFGPRMKGLFPQEPDRASFDYWHINYDTPIRMEYRREEEVAGLVAYVYESNFSTDQTDELTGVLEGVGETTGIILDVSISLWVEPYTGRIVQYADQAEAFYYDLETGERIIPWNKFHNKTSFISVTEQAKAIAILKQKVLLFELVIPISLIIISILTLVIYKIKGDIKKIFLSFSSSKQKLILPTVSAVVILVATIVTAATAIRITTQQIEAEFNSDATLVHRSIVDRLNIYANVLKGGRGLIDASDFVDRSEWKTYIDNLNLQRDYPGIQGFGFAVALEPDEVESIEQQVQDEGFEDFNVFPEYARDFYTSILYIEPFDVRNQLAFGYDMFTNDTRRKAMEFARDSGEIAISEKVTLLQEGEDGEQAGFLMYEPVYTTPNDSPESRRDNLFGYVYAAFRMNNLMVGVFAEDPTVLGVEIFDGGSINDTNISDEKRMYGNNLVNPHSSYERVDVIELFNHRWIVRYTAQRGYGFDVLRQSIPTIILGAGLLLALVAFILVYTINTRREQAVSIAQKMTKNLSTEKVRTDAILAGVGDGLFVTDANQKVTYVNDAFESITGFDESEVVGRRLTDVVEMVTKDGKTVSKAHRPLARVLKTKRQVVIPSTKGFYYRAKDGNLIPVSMAVSPILADKEFVGAVEVFRDVTQESNIDRTKTEFVSLASHQLKTPLTSINWYTELLLEDKSSLKKSQLEYVHTIEDAAQRMSDLVNSLLNISRLELGTFMIEPKLTSIRTIVKEVVSDQRSLLKERKQKLKVSYGKSIPKVPVDPQLTHIIIQNLVSNASKYSPDESSIELLVNADAKNITIQCIDHGYGIPKQQQGAIFTKLFRADNARRSNVDGTGLGLYIVKTIADTAGCSISFVSEEGKGTTFTFTIPLKGMKKKEGAKKLFEMQ